MKKMDEKISQYDVKFSEIPTRRDLFIKNWEPKLTELKQKLIDYLLLDKFFDRVNKYT